MNARVCRRLRRIVYGKGHHPGPIKHFQHPKIPGICIADRERQQYQALKRAYAQGIFKL